MTHPRRWFYPIYALLFALVLTVAYVGHTTAKSARQADSLKELNLIERTVLPSGDINQASQNASRQLVQLILYCERNDVEAALGKAEELPACAGALPAASPSAPNPTTPPTTTGGHP